MDRRNRSHPSLIHPLTTYPTSPSISASPSYIYGAAPSLPTTPSILSRNPSQSRLRPSISAPQAANTKLRSRARKSSARNSKVDISAGTDGEDWLARTASTVTMIGLEERGASWLVARRSSTSLLSGENADEDENENEAYYSPEWRGSRSRIQSQMGSARGSRSKLGSRRESTGVTREAADGEGTVKGEGVGPDFVDVNEEDGGEEGEGEVVDEGEMRRIVKGKIGGWVDWAVGWMDFRGDDGEEEEEGDEEDLGDEFEKGQGGEGDGKEALDVMELQKRLRRKKRRDEEAEDGDGNGEPGIVTPPPQGEDVGVWSDAKWLLGVATKVVL